MQTIPPGFSFFAESRKGNTVNQTNKLQTWSEQKKRDLCLINMGKYHHQKKRKLALSTK
jgi:hypothetical protein